MLLLGIETSCDETAVAVLENRQVRADLIASQDDLHAAFGGIVPELASRRHLEVLPTMVTEAMSGAQVTWTDLDGIAVTVAPGLIGALLVGLAYAKGIAFAHNRPLIGVNHLEGHLLVAMLEHPDLTPPFIGLVVSGGHTSLYFVEQVGQYRLLGATRDDAAGEAFDKGAKLLQLGYPGGPLIDRLAATGDRTRLRFPRPKLRRKGSPFEVGAYDLSFSGLKTALAQQLARPQSGLSSIRVEDYAAAFQYRIIEELVDRLAVAAHDLQCDRIVVAGGVAANRGLRARLDTLARKEGLRCFIPRMRYCTDNAVMIAWAGMQRAWRGEKDDLALNATAVAELGSGT
ncbi:MAG: tRNA (adenosine(37)-N6)-threonylcarbamoyltransferase complex transferase subunit TsaD [Deltaproteobacteria bacterium]|nr:tRNA (adenosine(37)-N6)-threonylcarbamoyltransferase complex transferase subunit TsaD [Deltaproteobacteria bacterium]